MFIRMASLQKSEYLETFGHSSPIRPTQGSVDVYDFERPTKGRPREREGDSAQEGLTHSPCASDTDDSCSDLEGLPRVSGVLRKSS
jgi:hypothetical protein